MVAVISGLLLAATVFACVGPVEIDQLGIVDVEAHLDATIGYVPAGCDPVGLDGDGRGTIVGSGFECPDGTSLRIERFDAGVNDDPLTSAPSETRVGRVEWRDGPTGDVIRVVSDDFDPEVLLQVAESIEIRN